jgi:hypothetical protein
MMMTPARIETAPERKSDPESPPMPYDPDIEEIAC